MSVNTTALQVAIVEVMTSWGAVYTALYLPAVLMLANFTFGHCFLSEAIGAGQHTEGSLHTRPRIAGRACIVAIILLLAWEYHVYFFSSRAAIEGAHRPGISPAACNPLYVIWDIADALPWRMTELRFVYLLDCAVNDLAFLSLLTGFAVSYLAAVWSVPQVEAAVGSTGSEKTSYCSKCAAHVLGMDHHCYLIGNCVGARNRRLFVTCLALGMGNLLFLLYWCGGWALWQASPVFHFGLVLVVVALTGLAGLLTVQLILIARGTTTLAVWKCAQCTGRSFVLELLDPSAPSATDTIDGCKKQRTG